jgi:hypothetical protein
MRLHHILPLATVAAMGLSMTAAGHGYAGKRFFPATILVEDPFVADELALPTWTHMKGGDVTSDDLEFEFAKRITSKVALSIDRGWSREHGGPDGKVDGFRELSTARHLQLYLARTNCLLIDQKGRLAKLSGDLANLLVVLAVSDDNEAPGLEVLDWRLHVPHMSPPDIVALQTHLLIRLLIKHPFNAKLML